MVEYQKAAADSLAAVFFMEEKIAVLRRLYKEVVSNSDARGHCRSQYFDTYVQHEKMVKI